MFNSPNNKTQIYGKTGSADRKTCLLNEEFYFFQYWFFFFWGGGVGVGGGGERWATDATGELPISSRHLKGYEIEENKSKHDFDWVWWMKSMWSNHLKELQAQMISMGKNIS